MDSKRGRKNLRQIKRASCSRRGGEELAEETHNNLTNYEEGGDEGIQNKNSTAASNDSTEGDRKEQVYNALLTLLGSDHPKVQPPSKKYKSAKNKREENEDGGYEKIQEEALSASVAQEDSDGDEEEEGFDQDGESDDDFDSFEAHFNGMGEDAANKLDKAFQEGKVQYQSVRVESEEAGQTFTYSKPVIVGSEEDKNGVEPPSRHRTLHSYFIKQKLRMHNNLAKKEEALTPLQKELVDPMFQYQDVLYEYDGYECEREYRDLYALHVLNHVYKTRDRILKNNQKLQEDQDQELLDQGFTRPKVLVVVPSRDVAYDVVNTIINKSGIDQVDKKSKFVEQFFEETARISSKPKSFQHIFKGNTNDFFILGMKFTRKAIKLYSNFYQSDVITCSPLGIQLILENTDKKKRQNDFLSSIELMVVDQLHSMEFQNFLHINTIFQHINKIPEQQHSADFSRIRMWYINEQARMFRQTMIFTRYTSPLANSLINGKCRNWAGRLKNHRIVSQEKSAINQLGLKVRQVFQRFDLLGGTSLDLPDYRFKFFTSVIVPAITNSTGYEDGILVYIADYTDYLRVRNYLKEKTTVLYAELNEYSNQRQLTYNRSMFQQGSLKVMLYTERLHHFRRFEIKGVKSVVFYQPPSNPEFYHEVVRFIGKSVFLGNADINISTVRSLYCKLDSLALERIVGTKRAAILTHGQNEAYEFR